MAQKTIEHEQAATTLLKPKMGVMDDGSLDGLSIVFQQVPNKATRRRPLQNVYRFDLVPSPRSNSDPHRDEVGARKRNSRGGIRRKSTARGFSRKYSTKPGLLFLGLPNSTLLVWQS